jgi:hypothetical protein
MAYCRFLDSDAYLFKAAGTDPEQFECCGCRLDGDVRFFSPEEAFWHLVAHELAGHAIAFEAFEALCHEAITGEDMC